MRNMNFIVLLTASLFSDRGPAELAAQGMEVMFVIRFHAGTAFFLAYRSRSTSCAWPAAMNAVGPGPRERRGEWNDEMPDTVTGAKRL